MPAPRELGRAGCEPALARVGTRGDSGERLQDLVCNRSGQLSHHRHTGNMREFRLGRAQQELSLAAALFQSQFGLLHLEALVLIAQKLEFIEQCALVKKSALTKAWLDLNEAIQEVLAIIAIEAGRHEVSVRIDLAAGLPSVQGDRMQLQQVVLDLGMNGIDSRKAVTESGRESY
jgi:signal transduction histidine kinase